MRLQLTPEQLDLAKQELASAARDGDRSRWDAVVEAVVEKQGDTTQNRSDLAHGAHIADAQHIGQVGIKWPA